MNVVAIFGSPRVKGNSAQLANRFLARAEVLGAEVQRFVLNKMNFKGCQGCDVCKTKLDRCVLEDDLTKVLDAVRPADLVVIATPVYFFDVPSQLKAFIDRTYSFVDADFMTNPDASRLKKGKKLLFIQSQEAGEGMYTEVFARYSLAFQFYGFECTLIQACGVGQKGDIQALPAVFEEVDQAAHLICGA